MNLGHSKNYKKMLIGIIVLYLIFLFPTVINASPTPTLTPASTPNPVVPGTTAGGGAVITIQDPHGVHAVTIKNSTTKQPDISWGHPGYCPGPTTITFNVGYGSKYQVYYEDCQGNFEIWEVEEILNGDPQKPTFIKRGKIIFETPKPEHHWWDFLKTYGLNMWSLLILLVIIISLVMFYRKRRK